MKTLNFQEIIDTLMAGNSQVVYQDENIFICENLSLLPTDDHLAGRDIVAMLFCAAGRAQVKITDRMHEVQAGDVLICSNMDILSDCLFSKDFRYAVVGASANYASQLVAGNTAFMEQFLYIRENPVLHLGDEARNILPAYALMFDMKIRQKPHMYLKQSVGMLITMALYDVLGYYERMREQDDSPQPAVHTTGSAALFKRFLVLMSQDNCRHRSVAYFADQLCITPKYLSSVCRRESGKTPLEWIHNAQVQRIRHLLLHTDMSVKEIASVMDFPNLSFFGKFVRQHLGMSPTAFRQSRMD